MWGYLWVGQPIADEAEYVFFHRRKDYALCLSLSDDVFHFATNKSPTVPHALNGFDEFPDRQALQQIAVDSTVHHALNDAVFVVDGESNDFDFRIFADGPLAKRRAVAVGDGYVEQQHIGSPLLHDRPTFVEVGEAAADAYGLTAIKRVGQSLVEHRVVVHDINVYLVLVHKGNDMLISLPSFSLVTMRRVPL